MVREVSLRLPLSEYMGSCWRLVVAIFRKTSRPKWLGMGLKPKSEVPTAFSPLTPSKKRKIRCQSWTLDILKSRQNRYQVGYCPFTGSLKPITCKLIILFNMWFSIRKNNANIDLGILNLIFIYKVKKNSYQRD